MNTSPRTLVRLPLLAALFLSVPLAPTGAASQYTSEWDLRAETSNYLETSSHAEVLRLLQRAAATHPSLHLTTMGYTNEGRRIPLLVAGRVRDASPEAVREVAAQGAPVIYLQGNIHAGEVAGKEALLRLVRELAHGERAEWTAGAVLLIGPIYNADGNERLDLRNRPRQHGPLAGMGTRPNAQGLDLNRDQMKLDSPEARSLARLMTEYNPDVVVDLHTTNGTRMAYKLTYAPPLHPATPTEIDTLLRDRLLPDATANWRDRHGWHMWHYGNVSTRGGAGPAWWTFDHRPRFVTNYAGIRNRIGILSEAYSYATFEERILASERFVHEIVEWVLAHPAEVRAAVRDADAGVLPGSRLPLRGGFASEAPTHPILLGEVVEEVNPWSGEIILRQTDAVHESPMAAHVAFTGTEDEVVPHGYLIPASARTVIERLRAHGIRGMEYSPANISVGGTLQRFRVTGRTAAPNPFQGRREVTLEGEWEAVPDVEGALDAEEHWFMVVMNQPLARLAFLLLEPRADDGFTAWGVLDTGEEGEPRFPILRVVAGGS